MGVTTWQESFYWLLEGPGMLLSRTGHKTGLPMKNDLAPMSKNSVKVEKL